MKLDSKYFDSIRITPRGGVAPRAAAPKVEGRCQWKGCSAGGEHRAPMGRGRDGEYFTFCFEHVRQYNATYDYFSGMSDAEVSDFQKDAVTGHRPTWRFGDGNSETVRATESARRFQRFRQKSADPFGVFGSDAGAAGGSDAPRRRSLRTLERKALISLGLDEMAGKSEVKARFKELVKRHHPDANGGDKGSEDRLREIIQAYNYLKQVGLV